MEGALSGCRVLDLTDDRGMFCGKLLSDMGAEVISAESPQSQHSRNPSFCYLNAGKKSITLDLQKGVGRELFLRLAKTVDVIVEDKPPGYLDTLGLGYARLREVNPGLVMASITGFGQSGPYRDSKSSDIVVSGLGGQMYINGAPDTPPLKPFGNQTGYMASLNAAIGILLALWNRHATGRGQHVDISAMECVTAALDHVLVRYFYDGVVAKRESSLYWNKAFRVFPCRDGYVLLSLMQQWETMVELLNSEGMAEDLTDKKWLSREERLKHIDHITDILERWTKSHTVDELVEKGQLMRFPWAKVATIPQLVNSPQLAARSFFVESECCGQKYKYPGSPCRLSRSSWRAGGKLPDTGEHNPGVFQELGLSIKEVEALSLDGVI